MKILLFVITLFITPLLLKAQDDPFGKSRNEVRKTYTDGPLLATVISKSDTCDTVSMMLGNIKAVYCFKKDTCYQIKMIFTYDYADMMRMVLSQGLKKIKEGTWVDEDKKQAIILTTDKAKNQCVFTVQPLVDN